MYMDFMLFTVIALITGVIILLRILAMAIVKAW